MALDKLVDSTQLDSDLTSVANAIRAKSGGSSPLAFPAGFVSEIENIPSGGGGTDYLAQKITNTLTAYEITSPTIFENALRGCTSLVSLTFPQIVTSIGQYAFYGCNHLTSLHFFTANLSSYNGFAACSGLVSVVCENDTSNGQSTYTFSGCGFKYFDLKTNKIGSSIWSSCNNLDTIILRKADSPTALAGLNALNTNPAFKSGGAGGTIYIPKALYDHLGDGTSLDYKAATNWSTLDGYGTVTWAKIEGSIYETQYADGTPISS